jgi:hypothetical protein
MIPGCGEEAIENSPGQQDFARGISNGITPDLLIGKALVKGDCGKVNIMSDKNSVPAKDKNPKKGLIMPMQEEMNRGMMCSGLTLRR